ncbi:MULTISPECIES: hypothetical protein [unclassified Tenacibaculum]|uniref:hypothetical protein n=1 Tax=unclassified Tenacibaculum TaxID=2635139 RepID=UPI001F3F7FC3|nr:MULTISPECIES: hypothetical protein [unclassified Tenacibaculum]MCF2874064.1 hypothetical protein [Tenacibaculum sp. Cn5-1]MCF2934645.1 hypothetical protein [Tenacibaculum sp. Cn5-34]MCG7510855.1 hypothetical protein [Tenacibaculum sp. Cn5-46]
MIKNISNIGTPLNKSQQLTIFGGIFNSGGIKTCVKCSNGYEKCCTDGKSPSVNCPAKTGSCVKTGIGGSPK